jgi:hypothetical protein
MRRYLLIPLVACSPAPVEPPPVVGTELCESEGLEVTPLGLSLGRLVVGTQHMASAKLRYHGCGPARLEVSAMNAALDCSGGAPLCLDSALPAVMEDGAEVELRIRFAPREVLSHFALLSFSGCPNRSCETELLVEGRGERTGVACVPNPIDFGAIARGRCESRELVCTNIVDRSVAVESVSLSSAGEITVAGGSPIEMGPEESMPVGLTYCPTDDGPDTTEVMVSSSVEGIPSTLSIEAIGRGGGGHLDAPAELDFGQVSLIAPSRVSFVVANSGTEPIHVTSVLVDPPFSSVVASAAALPAGASALLWLEAEAFVVGRIEGTATLVTDDPVRPTQDVSLVAEGVNLPPCEVVVTPEEVDFGAVPLGTNGLGHVEVQNVGPSECLLYGAAMMALRGPFAILDLEQQRIAPGASTEVSVKFLPTSSRTPSRGEMEIGISDPRHPFVQVQLFGIGS